MSKRAGLFALTLATGLGCGSQGPVSVEARITSQTGFPLVEWTGANLDQVDGFAISRSDAGGAFVELGRVSKLNRSFVDRLDAQDGVEYRYEVATLVNDEPTVHSPQTASTTTLSLPDTQIVDYPTEPLKVLNETDIKVAGVAGNAAIAGFYYASDVDPRARTTRDVIELRALSAGDHKLTVWAQDAAGNVDIAPPSVTFNVAVPYAPKLFAVEGGTTKKTACTRERDVTLLVSADGANEVKLSEKADLSDATWQAIPEDRKLTFALSEGEGTKRIYGRFRSAEGAESLTVADNVFFDVTPPTILITQPVPETVTSHATISVLGNFTDASPIAPPMVNGAYALIVGSDGFMRPLYPLSPGVNTIEVVISDCAGNLTHQSVDIVRDPNAPAGNCGT